ncbi:MAG: carbohydrate ABC transporter permease [Candidatus Humimicrobiaceae bacterium]
MGNNNNVFSLKYLMIKFKGSPRKLDAFNIFISILPITLLIILILIFPLLSVFFHGFTKWTITETRFIGLDNFKNLISNGSLALLLKNNLILLLAIPVLIFFSLIIAYLLYEEIWGWRIFRILFYLPSVFSIVIIGFLFKTFFALNGPLNGIIRNLHMDFLVVNWLGSRSTAFIVIIIAFIWSHYGFAVLIFLSGMSSIEPSILESAVVDGANWWQRFFRIVLPMIVNTIEFYLIVLIIAFFTASFGFIYSITSGGPGYGTTTLEYMIYIKAFKSNMLGQSSALATILFVMVLVMVIIVLKVFRKMEEWQE